MFQQLDLLFSTTPLAGPEQMALDEVLLRSIKKPTLRLYRWKGPCVTFGYFQKVTAVRKVFPQQVLVRRWTGGGMVQHGDDITFSLIVPQKWGQGLIIDKKESSEKFINNQTLTPLAFYEALHKGMASALQAYQIMARLAICEDIAKGEACFKAPALHDLLLENQKILGGAQRRAAGSLLYQGSLALPEKPDSKVAENIFHSLASTMSPVVTLVNERPVWLEQAAELAASRYGSTDWLEKR